MDILDFEKRLTTLFHHCGLQVVNEASSILSARHITFQLLNEQDDSLLDVLVLSLDLWK